MTRRPPLLLLGLAVALGAGALAAPACARDNDTECESICTVLDRCSMLPSPLGLADNEGLLSWTSRENCVARCLTSDTKQVKQLSDCLQPVTESDPQLKWCTNGSCSQASECLETLFDDPRVGGLGAATVEFVTVDEVAGLLDSELVLACPCIDGAETEGCDSDTGTDSTDTGGAGVTATATLTEADVYCESRGIARVEVVLMSTDHVEVLASGSCSEVLSASVSTQSLIVGRYQPALRVFTKGDGDVGQCGVYYGEAIVVSAGDVNCDSGSCLGQIPLPAPELSCLPAERPCFSSEGVLDENVRVTVNCSYPCELGTNACINTCTQDDVDCTAAANNDVEGDECPAGSFTHCYTVSKSIDDDCSGLSNCNDPACALDCTESGARCSDGLDNDNDGLIDCEDSDCADAAACGGGSSDDDDDGSTSTDDTDTSGTDTSGTDTSGDSGTDTTDGGSDSTG